MQTINIARTAAACAIALWLGGSLPATAQAPQGINYQGYLTNADGTPVDADINVTFAAYATDIGGAPLWTQSDTLSVEQGLFSATLANPVNPFPDDLFNGPVYIGLFVAGEEMLPRRALTANAYAFKAADADTLSGLDAAALNQSADVAALEGEVDAVQADIASVQADAGANAAGLSALQGDVTTNATRIINLESVGADITGVSAGSGLVGGGVAGNVSLGIGTGAVTGQMIADGAIGALDLASSQSYAMQALTLTERLEFDLPGGGSMQLLSSGSTSGLLWRDAQDIAAGTVAADDLGVFLSGGPNGIAVDLRKDGRVGLGGVVPNAGGDYTVAVPNLDVQGTIDINRTRVFQNFQMDDVNLGCFTFGGNECWSGTADAVCPVGTKVLGGGMSGVGGAFSSVASSYPVSDTRWRCQAAYFASGRTETCYAICADVE